MNVESTADQIAMLTDFGTVATVSGQPAITCTGIFDQQYLEVDPNGGVQVSANTSSFLIRSADAVTIPQGTIVQLAGIYYTIADLQRQTDGQFSTAILRRA